MSVEHLSDRQIQQYVDDKETGLGEDRLDHLNCCERCQGVLSGYQLLYRELGQRDKSLLSTDFTARTMARIEAEAASATGLDRTFMIFGICGLISCFAAIYYFVNIKALLQSIGSFSLTQMVSDSALASSIEGLSLRLGDNLGILIFAGLLLILVALADKLLVRQRTTRAYFLSI